MGWVDSFKFPSNLPSWTAPLVPLNRTLSGLLCGVQCSWPWKEFQEALFSCKPRVMFSICEVPAITVILRVCNMFNKQTEQVTSEVTDWIVFAKLLVQCDSFGTRPKKMRISQRLFIRFWTCMYDYIPCFMKSRSILVCRSLTSWRHRDNDWRLAPCRAQPCHCVVR